MVTSLTYTQEVPTSNLDKYITSPEIILCPLSTVKSKNLSDMFYMKLNTSDISHKNCCKQKLISFYKYYKYILTCNSLFLVSDNSASLAPRSSVIVASSSFFFSREDLVSLSSCWSLATVWFSMITSSVCLRTSSACCCCRHWRAFNYSRKQRKDRMHTPSKYKIKHMCAPLNVHIFSVFWECLIIKSVFQTSICHLFLNTHGMIHL